MVNAATKERPEATALAPREQGQVAVMGGDAQSKLYDIISTALDNPAVDPNKLEKLLDLALRVRAEDAKTAFIAAMTQMKPDLPIIDRKGHIVIHEKGKEKVPANVIQDTAFARWEDIDEAITPILQKHGFVLTFRSGTAPDGKVSVTAVLSHKLGHSEETTIALMHDGSGSKNPVQAIGSSLSYGKRYAATFLLNIRTKGEDDDGTEAGADETIDDTQIQNIIDMLARDEMDKDKFCKAIKVDSIPDIKRRDYQAVVTKINEVSLQRAALRQKKPEPAQ